MTDSRTGKSLKNAKVNVLFYFLMLLLTFFSRKIFLDCLGAEFLGFTETVYNLLAMLNLAEMGIGSAIAFVLYKPLLEKAELRINEIVSVLGYLFRLTGILILSLGLLLACFLPFIYSNTSVDVGVIYFAYFSFLTSSLLSYIVNYKQVLLSADQRNYVITTYYQSANILKTIIQLLLAYYFADFYLWITIELTFSIICSIVLNRKIKQTYPWLQSEIKKGRALLEQYPGILKKAKQLFVHKIGFFTQNQTTPLFIYSFVSIQMVACYTNYSIIIYKLNQLVTQFMGGTLAGVGSLVAEGNKAKILQVYWELISVRLLFAGIIIFGLYYLMTPLVTIWLGSEYVLSKTVVILLMITVFLHQLRDTQEQFIAAYGLFGDVWAPITEALIFVFLAVALGYLWGLEGVLTATVISKASIGFIWKPIFLFRHGFGILVRIYWLNIARYIAILAGTGCISAIIAGKMHIGVIDNFQAWAFYALKLLLVFVALYFFSLLLFTQGMRNFCSRTMKKYIHD